jgi:UDP-GlcNAc:undecaprenyl-phosphate GlcNAc-1-phosphate transferase
LFITSAAIAACLTRIVRDGANKYGLTAGPTSPRHIHEGAIPRLGGVAIFSTFLIICGFYLLAIQQGFVHAPRDPNLLKILLPASGLFFVGLVDDLRGLSPKTKLLAQVSGGIFLYVGGFRFVCLHTIGGHPVLTTLICLSLTVFWVVLICNAINLIDGLDGLAAGATLFSMVTIFAFALVNGRPEIALIVAILAGANLGFLIFNFNPASIFLGDSGSLFIGFMLSALVMSESQKQPDVLRAVLVPVVSLAVPLTDLTLTVLRRFLSGRALFRADREHIHHKLLESGLNQRQVVWILYGISASCAIFSLALLHPSRIVWVPTIAMLLLLIFFGIRKLGYQEFAEFARLALRIGQQRKIVASNIAVKKASALLERTHSVSGIGDTLEECLKGDFNGFEIVLSLGFAVAACQETELPRLIERVWTISVSEVLVLKMELTSPRYGLIGHISLEHSSNGGHRLLVDSDLLQRNLRNSLCIAIENCFSLNPPSRVLRTEHLPSPSSRLQ